MNRLRLRAARALAVALLLTGVAPGGMAFAQEVVSYEIGPGPLSQALTDFGRQSGLQLAFDPALAVGQTSTGLSGTRPRPRWRNFWREPGSTTASPRPGW